MQKRIARESIEPEPQIIRFHFLCLGNYFNVDCNVDYIILM